MDANEANEQITVQEKKKPKQQKTTTKTTEML